MQKSKAAYLICWDSLDRFKKQFLWNQKYTLDQIYMFQVILN